MKAIVTIHGNGLPLEGNGLDTDRIIPARFLRGLTFEGLGDHVFEDDRKQSKKSGQKHPFDEACYGSASILLVGDNFGCGSSREHAPQSLYRWGIRAIIGLSFADIFRGNSVALGMPCAQAENYVMETLWTQCSQHPQTDISLDVKQQEVRFDGHHFPVHFDAGDQKRFLEGTWDPLLSLLEVEKAIKNTASYLPYMNNFR